MNWIKVTDQMPKHGETVLVCYTTHHSARQVIVVGHYLERFKEEARTDEDHYEYREEDDTYYVVEGWYETQRNWDGYTSIYIHEGHITHWAPLPETPKEKTMDQREMTFGEKAVGLTFNPSGDPTVEAIKRKCADLIDEIHELRTNQPNAEIARMASVAITEIQTGQMWAVKAATWKF